ncbi:MAG: recombinase family protein, partial [Candidatus Sericytochromatia bacterium]
MKKAYAYLWLAPRIGREQESALRQQREQILQQACQEQNWQFTNLEIDRSLNTTAAERPVLKRLLRRLGENDLLLVSDLIDLGRRFYDVYALMELFRQTRSRGSLVALAQDLRINRHEGSDVLVVLSRIPQLNGISQPEADDCKRSEVSRSNGGACPYGYAVDPESNEFVVDAGEASIVQRIFKQRARGQSLRQIALALTQAGISTKRGGRWHANTI